MVYLFIIYIYYLTQVRSVGSTRAVFKVEIIVIIDDVR